MGFLVKLFGGSKKQDTAVAEIAVACPHTVLVPRWDSVQDMGREDKATRFMCEACHEMFSPEEAEALRNSVSERMSASLEEIQKAAPAPEEATEE
jgi:streptomycin 6-kinase